MGAHPYDGIAAAVFPPGGRCPGLGGADALADAACWLCQAAVAASGLLVILFLLRRRHPRGCAPKPGGGTDGQSRARDPAPPEAGQEKRPAADPLRDGPERYRFLVESIRDYAIILLDPRGRITSWNPGAEWISGYTEPEALGQPVSRLFPEAEQVAGRPERILRLAAETGRYEDEGWRLRKDGSRFLASGVIAACYDAHGTLQGFTKVTRDITGANQAELQTLAETLEGQVQEQAQALRARLGVLGSDITERRQADLALLQSQKLESLGVLAGGIAHDFNNLLGSSISKKARMRLDLHPQLPPMEADPAQIQQVIMNLVINAAEAIGEQNGVITVSTRPDELAPASAELLAGSQPFRPGPHVRLEVADTGIGMTPEVLKRIYDPFFTTKFAGRGLGLAAIHGIVRGHHGCIQVASQPGRGSTFTLRFPAAPGQPGPPAPEPEPPALCPPAPAGRARGTVLVVDDEDAMRSVVVDALDRAGLATLEARDGVEALDLYQYHRDAIRLVILDLTMPNLDGEETCREFRRRGSRMPIVLTSGFDEAEVRDRLRGLEVAGFIQKPFGLGALVELVLRLLPAQA